MFIFNLSSITASERLLSAELHIYKRKVKSSRRKAFHLKLHELSQGSLSDLGSRMLAARSIGWQAADLSAQLTTCLHHATSLLVVSVLASNRDGQLRRVNLNRMSSHLSTPFLVVFSNEAQNISVDHIEPHLRNTDLTRTFVQPETGRRETFGTELGDLVTGTERQRTVKRDRGLGPALAHSDS